MRRWVWAGGERSILEHRFGSVLKRDTRLALITHLKLQYPYSIGFWHQLQIFMGLCPLANAKCQIGISWEIRTVHIRTNSAATDHVFIAKIDFASQRQDHPWNWLLHVIDLSLTKELFRVLGELRKRQRSVPCTFACGQRRYTFLCFVHSSPENSNFKPWFSFQNVTRHSCMIPMPNRSWRLSGGLTVRFQQCYLWSVKRVLCHKHCSLRFFCFTTTFLSLCGGYAQWRLISKWEKFNSHKTKILSLPHLSWQNFKNSCLYLQRQYLAVK